MAVRQGLAGGKQIVGRDQGFVAQQATEALDFLWRPGGKVGQGALAGFVALAPALAEEDGGRGVAVGDDGDIHANVISQQPAYVTTIIYTTWEHFYSPKLGFRSNKSETYLKIQADFFSNFGLVAADAFRPHRLSPLGCRIPDAAAFDKASGSLFLHFAVLKAWR